MVKSLHSRLTVTLMTGMHESPIRSMILRNASSLYLTSMSSMSNVSLILISFRLWLTKTTQFTHIVAHVIAEQEMIKLMIWANDRQSIVSYANTQFKTWLHIKMWIDVEIPLIDPLRNLGYVTWMTSLLIRLSSQSIAHARKIYPPHARYIKHLFMLDLVHVICHNNNNFNSHNIACLFCANHLESICANMLNSQVQLATLKEDIDYLIIG